MGRTLIDRLDRLPVGSLLSALLDRVPGGVILLNAWGEIVEWNQGAETLLGISAEEVRGSGLARHFPPGEQQRLMSLTQSCLQGSDFQEILDYWHPTGKRKRIQVQATRLEAEDQDRCLLLTLQEAGEQRAHPATETLRESEALFHAFMDNSPVVAFLVDEEFRLLYANKPYLHQFDLTTDALNRPVSHFPPEFVAQYQANFRAALQSGKTIEAIETYPRPDGTLGYALVYKFPFQDAAGRTLLGGVGMDVTDRLRAEEAVRLAHRQREELIASVDGIVWEADPETCQFTYVSPQAERLLGYPTRLWLEDPNFWAEHLHPEDREQAISYCTTCTREKRDHQFDYRFLAADGRVVWLHDLVSVIVENGRPVKLRGIMVDITQRKQAEEERLKFELQLQHTQKLESLGVMAGGIAHDFNNLLTSILGYADLALLELPPSSPACALIDRAVEGARRAAELTQQLLAYSGKGRFVIEPVNLSSLTEDMTRLLQVSLSRKCSLTYDLMRDLPAVEADASQMRQVIMNLILNASEAIGEQSGVIAVSTGVQQCDRSSLAQGFLDESLPEGPYVYLEVTDTGCGMSEETRAKIFDPFFTTKFTGRGLGLSAVLGIVRGHHGTILCRSEPGKGTTFRVLLPVSGSSARPRTAPGTTGTKWRGRGTVLVVDDEESVRGLARRMMESMGFSVLTASDGWEAIEVFRSTTNPVRLVLLDLTMPRLDGEETLNELRRLRGDVRAILSSGYNEQTVTERFAGTAPAGFIQKPYRFEQLQALVRNVLGE